MKISELLKQAGVVVDIGKELLSKIIWQADGHWENSQQMLNRDDCIAREALDLILSKQIDLQKIVEINLKEIDLEKMGYLNKEQVIQRIIEEQDKYWDKAYKETVKYYILKSSLKEIVEVYEILEKENISAFDEYDFRYKVLQAIKTVAERVREK